MTKEKILELPLKAIWFNMIRNGLKREEYREIKPYWTKRLINERGEYKKYFAIRFRYGYTKRTILVRLKGISVGYGDRLLGAPDKEVYILHLGSIIRQ